MKSSIKDKEIIRTYVKQVLLEQAVAQPVAQQQKPVAANVQQAQKNVQDAVGVALKNISAQLPAILKSFADSDKDGKVEYGTFNDKAQVPQQQAKSVAQTKKQTAPQAQPTQVKESKIIFEEGKFQEHLGINEAGVVGLVASAPAILSIGGKLLGKLGKKVNAQWMQNVGGKIANAGNALHHSYIGVFEKALTPFMKGASKEQVHTAAEALFMVIVGTMLAQGVTNPNVLSAVKGSELASYVSRSLPKILPAMGFA